MLRIRSLRKLKTHVVGTKPYLQIDGFIQELLATFDEIHKKTIRRSNVVKRIKRTNDYIIEDNQTYTNLKSILRYCFQQHEFNLCQSVSREIAAARWRDWRHDGPDCVDASIDND